MNKEDIVKEVVGEYLYRCNDCNKITRCYVDKRLEVEQRPTPFMEGCPCCKGTMQDASGYIEYGNAIQTTIPEHSNSLSFAVYLLTDKDLRQYGDMACGNLHINKNGKLISVHEATHE